MENKTMVDPDHVQLEEVKDDAQTKSQQAKEAYNEGKIKQLNDIKDQDKTYKQRGNDSTSTENSADARERFEQSAEYLEKRKKLMESR